MSLGSNTGRHRGNALHIIKQTGRFNPMPKNLPDGGGSGKIPTFVIVGFLVVFAAIILFRVW